MATTLRALRTFVGSLVVAAGFTSGGQALAQSAKARAKNNVGLGLRYGAVNGIGFMPGAELSFGIGSKFQFGLSAFGGQADMTEAMQEVSDKTDEDNGSAPTVIVEEFILSSSLYLAHARWFLGNSFYIDFGAGQRKIEFDLAMTDANKIARLESATKTSSTVAYAAIGNQWTWDSGFFFGFDWIGINSPMASESETETTLSAATNPDLEEKSDEFDDIGKALGEATVPVLLVMSLGWSF